MPTLLLLLGAVGHVILWVALVNRLHAVAIRRRWIDLMTGLCGIAVAGIPLVVIGTIALQITQRASIPRWSLAAVWSYLAACSVVTVVALVQWCYHQRHPERRGALLANHTARHTPTSADDKPLAAPGVVRWLTRVPFNQALDIHVHEKQLAIPRLVPPYDGLRIAHLSDLHMSGRIGKAYFEHVVDHVNRCEPDIVAITGDIIERNKCIDWIPDTLGQLHSKAGVYYVLGNHDRHVDESRLHAALAEAGLIYLGGTWRQIDVGKVPLILAGNELPWYKPAADMACCPAHNTDGMPIKVLLAHSPDQFGWAQRHEFDLMLAGHNHGGQVRVPVLGAILAPSLHGTRYAAGAFRSGNTVLHVSRGTACHTPIRFNCPPEIALLVLRAAS